MMKISRVLVSDDIDPILPELLKNNGVQVTQKTNMTPAELCAELATIGHDALVVRSATKVTAEVLAASPSLKLVGRAGTGVDNVDVAEATRRGVIVMNTPRGNARSAAELACCLLLSMARNVPQAHRTMKAGGWDRKKFMGVEVSGKTLAVIGLGHVGRDVATRMQAFGMHTIGYDPFVSAEQSAAFGVEWMELANIWPRADYVTLHVPLIAATKEMISKSVLNACKRNVRFINCSRGGLIDEAALLDALDQDRCGGAAFDTYIEEPPRSADQRRLVEHDKVVCTPHLGASTAEAQTRVAREMAEQIVQLNDGTALVGALNAPAVAAVLEPQSADLIKAVQAVAQLFCVLNRDADPKQLTVEYPDTFSNAKAIKVAAYVGLLRGSTTDTAVNLINGEQYAKEAGISVETRAQPRRCVSLSSSKCAAVCAFPSAVGPVLSSIDGQNYDNGIVLKGVVALCTAGCAALPETLCTKATLCTKGCTPNACCFPQLSEQELAQLKNVCNVATFT